MEICRLASWALQREKQVTNRYRNCGKDSNAYFTPREEKIQEKARIEHVPKPAPFGNQLNPAPDWNLTFHATRREKTHDNSNSRRHVQAKNYD
jgi:hypothetical protein